MDYMFTGNGTEDGLSLQDMIECDMRSMKYEGLHNPDGLGTIKDTMDGLGVGIPMEFGREQTESTTVNGLSDKLNLSDLSWLQTVNVSNVIQAENTDPNLLVDPQTGMPIGTIGLSITNNSAAVTVNNTSQSQQTLNQVNTNALTSPRIATPNGLIQRAQGQFVTIPTSIPNTMPQNFLQHHQQQQHQSSPSLRQHLQNIHHQQQHRNLPSPVNHTTVVYQNGTVTSHQQNVHSPQHAQPKTPQKIKQPIESREKVYPKPVYSYSCLIAMALKNSETGALPVSEIYNFMT